MKISFTKEFAGKAKKLSEDPKIKSQLKKQLTLFQRDIRHPGLKVHKLKGKRSHQYAIWIHGNLRALAVIHGEVYIFFDLISHDQY